MVPSDVRSQRVDVNGVSCLWMWPSRFAGPADAPAQLLYVHGGAFCLGSADTHSQLTCQIARRANIAVLSPDYRRCPEAAITHAHEDVINVYRYMAEGGASTVGSQGGGSTAEGAGGPVPVAVDNNNYSNSNDQTNVQPLKLLLGGESAGANIALAVALKIRHGRVPLPQAQGLALMSPWANLVDAIERKLPSWEENEDNDFVLAGLAQLFATWVLAAQKYGGVSAKDDAKRIAALGKEELLEIARSEDVSPALARDLSGLPPVLVTTGSCETLRDSQLALVERLEKASVQVQSELLKDMPHAVGLANFAASAKCTGPMDVVDRYARFLDECCGIPYQEPVKGGCCCGLQ